MGSSMNTPCHRREWRNSVLRVDTWSGEKSHTWKEGHEIPKRWVEGTLELDRRPLFSRAEGTLMSDTDPQHIFDKLTVTFEGT